MEGSDAGGISTMALEDVIDTHIHLCHCSSGGLPNEWVSNGSLSLSWLDRRDSLLCDGSCGKTVYYAELPPAVSMAVWTEVTPFGRRTPVWQLQGRWGVPQGLRPPP